MSSMSFLNDMGDENTAECTTEFAKVRNIAVRCDPMIGSKVRLKFFAQSVIKKGQQLLLDYNDVWE